MHFITDTSLIGRLILLVTLASAGATAQENGGLRFGAGIRLCANLTGYYSEVTSRESTADEASDFTAGPVAELRLSHRIAIEAGALYRGVNRRSSGAYVLTWGQRESGSAWDFPVVGKFRFAFAPAGFRPFVTAGPVFFILRSTVESSGTTLVEGPDGRPVSVPYSTTDSKRDSGTGFTAGGGIEKLAGRARISFEGRLTIWPGQAVNQGGVGCGIVCHQSPQFGIGF